MAWEILKISRLLINQDRRLNFFVKIPLISISINFLWIVGMSWVSSSLSNHYYFHTLLLMNIFFLVFFYFQFVSNSYSLEYFYLCTNSDFHIESPRQITPQASAQIYPFLKTITTFSELI